MNLNVSFFLNSILFGVGLAMDAFSVSIANGLNEPKMKKRRMFLIAGVFAFFQALMPLLGWVCVHTLVSFFSSFQRFIPWIALILLCYIGISMILEAIRNKNEISEAPKVGLAALLVQGIATSIDALSVGFTTAEYVAVEAILEALIIAAVTFVICTAGIIIGKTVGGKFANRAGILGGAILIFIGLEIFITGVF